jgi:hypothetical protein
MAGTFRYGFKTEAECFAISLRAELGLTVADRLDCVALAAHLEIPVMPLQDLRQHGADAKNIAHLMGSRSGFSAMTICAGTRKLIVYNPRHPMTRRANSLAHEISHVLLEHPPAPALGAGGCRNWDRQLEDEADWQAAALLVPRDGAFSWLRAGGDLGDGAEHFGVSVALFRWRANMTGVTKQLAAMGVRLR